MGLLSRSFGMVLVVSREVDGIQIASRFVPRGRNDGRELFSWMHTLIFFPTTISVDPCLFLSVCYYRSISFTLLTTPLIITSDIQIGKVLTY